MVNNLTRLRLPSGSFRVTIFGSARIRPEHWRLRRGEALWRPADMGCDIVTGGGPGALMQAANEGARALGRASAPRASASGSTCPSSRR